MMEHTQHMCSVVADRWLQAAKRQKWTQQWGPRAGASDAKRRLGMPVDPVNAWPMADKTALRAQDGSGGDARCAGTHWHGGPWPASCPSEEYCGLDAYESEPVSTLRTAVLLAPCDLGPRLYLPSDSSQRHTTTIGNHASHFPPSLPLSPQPRIDSPGEIGLKRLSASLPSDVTRSMSYGLIPGLCLPFGRPPAHDRFPRIPGSLGQSTLGIASLGTAGCTVYAGKLCADASGMPPRGSIGTHTPGTMLLAPGTWC
jgi:hypothetical protein